MSERGLRGLEALGPISPPASSSGDVGAVELGRRIKEARARTGLTGEQLGKQVELGKDQISKIENGNRRVNVRELPRLARALGVTLGYLLGEPARPRLAMAHRLAANAEAGAERPGRRRALELLEAEDALSRRAQPLPALASPAGQRVRDFARGDLTEHPRNKNEANRQGRLLAEKVREDLNLGDHELGDLAGLIERSFGVDVALSPLGTQADGLCVHLEDAALIVASTDYPEGHVRFTLAHELGHHLLGDPRDVIDEVESDMFAGNSLQERRVNAFAAHLLMPEQGLRESLKWLTGSSVTERSLVALMDRFGVSLAALIYQLVDLRLITFEQGQELRKLRVGDLVARNADVAPSGAGTQVRRTVRAPERLLGCAVQAAREEKIGLSVVATLLERDDDDALWDDVMEPPVGVLS
jgi:Zn-dependent peptidase ImmA (M78 family)/DNA-binding XRE family transcriptional regulator